MSKVAPIKPVESPWQALLAQLPYRDPRGYHDGKLPYWDVPATGEWVGGCKTGKAAAIAYLKYLGELQRTPGAPYDGHLAGIALAMFGENCDDSLRGQIVGFFSRVDKLLLAATHHLYSPDEEVSFASLGEQMKEGLAWTKADDVEQERRWRSEAARLGWETRRRNAAASVPGTLDAAVEGTSQLQAVA
jgi:hypothetical protein